MICFIFLAFMLANAGYSCFIIQFLCDSVVKFVVLKVVVFVPWKRHHWWVCVVVLPNSKNPTG